MIEPYRMQKPLPPERPEFEEEDYDDGDPYSCIAAGAAGIKTKGVPPSPNYGYLLWKAFTKDDSDAVRQMAEKDPVGVKYALYAMWDNGRDFVPHRDRGQWAGQQMAELGDPSLVEYDLAVPPIPPY